MTVRTESRNPWRVISTAMAVAVVVCSLGGVSPAHADDKGQVPAVASDVAGPGAGSAAPDVPVQKGVPPDNAADHADGNQNDKQKSSDDTGGQDDKKSNGVLTQRGMVQVGVVGVALIILSVVATALIKALGAQASRLAQLGGEDKDSRRLMFQMAFGLPDGTIRSALAIFIVIGALLTLIAAMANDLGFKVPDALAGVFGTILGFYFGRSGSVETAQASAAVTAASQATSDATKSVADAQVKTIEAQQALQASQDDQTDAVSGDTDAALEVITAIVNELPPPPNPNLQSQLTACANAIKDAKAQGDLTLLKSAYAQLMTSGPLATLLSQDLPGLSPFVTAGTSTLDCARALVSLSMRIRPAVAQLWVARLLRQPYRTELFTPVIDTAYANQLLGQVGDAGALLQPTKGPGATMTASDLVGAALSECGAQQIVDRWSLPISQVAPVVESLQQRAFEMELMKALSADDFKPFNGPSAFFTNLEKVQATPSGQQALDLLMLVLREARNAAVSAVDLLPQGT